MQTCATAAPSISTARPSGKRRRRSAICAGCMNWSPLSTSPRATRAPFAPWSAMKPLAASKASAVKASSVGSLAVPSIGTS